MMCLSIFKVNSGLDIDLQFLANYLLVLLLRVKFVCKSLYYEVLRQLKHGLSSHCKELFMMQETIPNGFEKLSPLSLTQPLQS